ncbi:MAG: hypothetical protein KF773_00025 [Deltaproteobacteria bacterium]|nr:hypothetical protein [Deltaproteobacteria bacterium]
MRPTTVLATIALASTTLLAAAPVREAGACGTYAPEVMLLSAHLGPAAPGTGTRFTRRTFALLGDRVPAHLAWSRLSPGTYDGTEIAPGSVYGPRIELTLVGPSGARRVSATDHVYLRRTFARDDAQAAVEVPSGDFRIAIAGRADEHARFLELDGHRDATGDDRLWVSHQRVDAYNAYVSISPIRGTAYEAITVAPRNGDARITLLRTGGALANRLDGTVLGGLTTDGDTYVLVEHGGALRAVAL